MGHFVAAAADFGALDWIHADSAPAYAAAVVDGALRGDHDIGRLQNAMNRCRRIK